MTREQLEAGAAEALSISNAMYKMRDEAMVFEEDVKRRTEILGLMFGLLNNVFLAMAAASPKIPPPDPNDLADRMNRTWAEIYTKLNSEKNPDEQ